MHNRAVAVTRGMRYLREQGVPFAEHRYEHRVKGAAYAAEALGLEPALVAKTLVAELASADLARLLSPTPIGE